MMNNGFYAGSFDPFTSGHMHVVKTASKLFDRLVIGIGDNNQKKRKYNKDVMKAAIEKTLVSEKINNVVVVNYEGLSVDAAKDNECNFLVRGIRDDMDYYYDDIGAGLKLHQLQRQKRELMSSLEMYYRVMFLNKTVEEAGKEIL